MRFPPSLLGLALLAPWAQAASPLLIQIEQSRDLICDLRAAGELAPEAPRRLMLVIENVRTPSARLVSSAGAGARPLRVYSGDTGVHFVEDVEASVKVTSLLSCDRWKESAKGRQCTRYEAVNRWHFDTTVHRNADQAYLRLAENSYTGWCEPWRME
jgi:hypothetical protein